MKSAKELLFLLKPLVGHKLRLDCGHYVKLTEKGFSDTVVIWTLGGRIILQCYSCAY
jgi:hypothetical protein